MTSIPGQEPLPEPAIHPSGDPIPVDNPETQPSGDPEIDPRPAD